MKVSFFGTGLMGQAMVFRLLASAIPVVAYNRTYEKLLSLQEAGAKITNSAQEAIESADCLVLMLSDYQAIENVLLAEANLPVLTNRCIIQMGTIAPQQSYLLRDTFTAVGAEYLEAPVLGSTPEAKIGELLVMVGATSEQFNKYSPLLEVFGKNPRLVGTVGKAAALKLALNQLIAGLTSTFALSLGLVQSFGVETEQFMEILRQSALYAPTFDKKLKRMCSNDYASPNFPTKHLLKDVDLFLQEAQREGLDSSGLEGIRDVVQKALELGFAEDDYSAIFSAILKK